MPRVARGISRIKGETMGQGINVRDELGVREAGIPNDCGADEWGCRVTYWQPVWKSFRWPPMTADGRHQRVPCLARRQKGWVILDVARLMPLSLRLIPSVKPLPEPPRV